LDEKNKCEIDIYNNPDMITIINDYSIAVITGDDIDDGNEFEGFNVIFIDAVVLNLFISFFYFFYLNILRNK